MFRARSKLIQLARRETPPPRHPGTHPSHLPLGWRIEQDFIQEPIGLTEVELTRDGVSCFGVDLSWSSPICLQEPAGEEGALYALILLNPLDWVQLPVVNDTTGMRRVHIRKFTDSPMADVYDAYLLAEPYTYLPYPRTGVHQNDLPLDKRKPAELLIIGLYLYCSRSESDKCRQLRTHQPEAIVTRLEEGR